MSGLIFFLEKRLHIFTMQIPEAIESPKAKNPPTTMPMVCQLRNACTVIVAPTQRPRKTVAVFMMELAMVSKRRAVSDPISLSRLPNMSMPMSDTADGTRSATIVVTAMGKIILSTFSFLIFWPEGKSLSCSFMLILSSFSEQSILTTRGMMTGTRAMYE